MVVAIGFQARWFEDLLGEAARHRLARGLDGAGLEKRIEPDLSVARLAPPLHLPVVAGLAQDLGFPNLSCLGLLSDQPSCAAMSPWPLPAPRRRKGKNMPEVPDEVWESDDCVHRTVVMPAALAERLAAAAERRGLSVSALLVEYAEAGLERSGGSRDQGAVRP